MGYVAYVSIDTDGSATDTLVTGAFTTSGSSRHIDVHVGIRKSGGNVTVSSITRTGTTFTHQRTDNNPSGTVWHNGSFWITTAEPQTGSAAATIVLGESNQYWGASFVILDDVDQTTRIRGGSVSLNPDGDTTVDVLALSSATGDLVVSTISGTTTASGGSSGGTETDRGSWNTGSSDAWGIAATAPGATTVNLDWATSLFRFVHYAVSHPPGDTAPVVTIPTGYIATNNLGARTISGISVTEGTSPITLVTCTCTSGKGTMTMTASGSSVVNGNGTNAINIVGGSETDINNTLATFAFTGLEPTRENVTVSVLASDGTLNDSENLVLFNHRTSLTIVADSYADLVAMIQTAKMILPEGSTTGDVEIVAEDDDTNIDTQTITLFVPSGTSGGGFLLQFRRRRRQ